MIIDVSKRCLGLEKDSRDIVIILKGASKALLAQLRRLKAL